MIAWIRRVAGMVGLLVVGLAFSAPRPVAAETITTVETGGFGMLTLCRNWILFWSCHSYHHVAVPDRFALGDKIDLTFGSNTKKISYRAARVARDGAHCTIFDAAAGGSGQVDKLDITPCRLVAPDTASPP